MSERTERGTLIGPSAARAVRHEYYPGGRRVKSPVMFARYRCPCGQTNEVLIESWKERGFHECKNRECGAHVYLDDGNAYEPPGS